MDKNKVYVPIANKKEAKQAKAVLKALGENIAPNYFNGNESGLWYWYETGKPKWICFVLKDNYDVVRDRKEVTLKELIELLVTPALDLSGCNVQNRVQDEKIAVRVENEKEFKRLMEYFKSLGWKTQRGGDTNSIAYNHRFGINHTISVHDGFFAGADKTELGYKIIPFSDFAKEHNIKLTIIKSEDGVWLFEGDTYFRAFCKDGKFSYNGEWGNLTKDSFVVTDNDRFKAFSTKEAAEKWIEDQKPKSISINLTGLTIPSKIFNNGVIVNLNSGNKLWLSVNDIKAIHGVMEVLKND